MNKRKRRNKRIEPPNAKITRTSEPKSATFATYVMDAISIVEYHPDDKAQDPATQVHVLMRIKDYDEAVFALRFKKPEILGFFIEELIAFRKHVWADAESVNPDVVITDDQFSSNDLLDNLEEEVTILSEGYYRCSDCNRIAFLMSDGSTMTTFDEHLRFMDKHSIPDGFETENLPLNICPACDESIPKRLNNHNGQS